MPAPLRFYRSIPLEDIYPPPKSPTSTSTTARPSPSISTSAPTDGRAEVWLRIDGGPMQTAERGETLRFGPLIDGVALLASADARPAPRSATLTVQPDLFGTEALFAHRRRQLLAPPFHRALHADRRDVIVWVFDAAGTRARTWRGSAVRLAALR